MNAMTITEAARTIYPGREVTPTLINTARRFLARHDVKPLHRTAGRGGQNVYDAQQVRDAIANRPGRANRPNQSIEERP